MGGVGGGGGGRSSSVHCTPPPSPPPSPLERPNNLICIKLSATDVLAPTTMKNAAKCDTSCDLQNPVNHRNFERILRSRDMPGSMLVGEEEAKNRPPDWTRPLE